MNELFFTMDSFLDEAPARCEQEGIRAVEAFRRNPLVLRESYLGAFNTSASSHARFVRRMLLASRVPSASLAWLRPFMGGTHRAAFDRFLRQYAFWRGVRARVSERDTWRRLTRTPLILMYHGVGRPGEVPSRYIVPRSRFREQMAWLYWAKYKVISLPELVRGYSASVLMPPRAVILTFDDGYADNHAEALPVLRRYKFPATFFLVSGAIGSSCTWSTDPNLAGRRMMTQTQIRQLLAEGMNIGAHTVSHTSLTAGSRKDPASDARISREDLEHRFHRRITTFAYPFGDCDSQAVTAVARAGFHAACGSRSGRNDPATSLFELRRVEVRGTDSLARFMTMLCSATRRRPTRWATLSRPLGTIDR